MFLHVYAFAEYAKLYRVIIKYLMSHTIQQVCQHVHWSPVHDRVFVKHHLASASVRIMNNT